MENIAILVLNYNTFLKSKKCIESCKKQIGINYTIFLVDNNSNDDSLKKIKEIYKDSIEYIKFDDNYGYAGGNNKAIKIVNDLNYDYSFILNSDTELIGEFLLKNLMQGFKMGKNIAMVAPYIYNVTSNGNVLNPNKSIYLDLLVKSKILPFNKKIYNDEYENILEAQRFCNINKK